MPDATSPQGTADATALSFEESVETLTNLDLDETPDPQEEDEGTEGNEGEGPDEADATGEDPVGEEAQDGSQEVAAGGKFVSQDAKVRLQDGSVITVGELARNNLFQRDYTTKTTEHAKEVETFKAQRTKVETFAQQVLAEREFFLQAAQQLLPQPPDESLITSEPLEYMAQKAAYEKSVGLLQQLQYQHQMGLTRKQEEATGQTQEARKREAEKLFEAMPDLRKPGAYPQFWKEAVETMADYGFTEAELNEVSDHRMYKAMRDLSRLRKALKKAPKVQEQVQAKPKLIAGGKRMDPKAKISRERQSLAEQQRRSGSLEDTVKRLESLI
jgi:hypothetical protein